MLGEPGPCAFRPVHPNCTVDAGFIYREAPETMRLFVVLNERTFVGQCLGLVRLGPSALLPV